MATKKFNQRIERGDDVSRVLEAKNRHALIQNFNKTNLGKQLLAHMNSTNGGSLPLVLALNKLVSEFLYAQNCHFTLSVFCAEIPVDNALPDFESMRNFRFNEKEINDIWETVTGTGAGNKPLDPSILEEYETNLNNSLLLLFVKSLVEQKPSTILRKSVETQTEVEVDHQPRFKRRTVSVATENPTQYSLAKISQRVESAFSKAIANQKEQWQNEMDVKIKQIKSQIKLHYKHKMVDFVEEQTNEKLKLNENIEMQLKDFEMRHNKLLQILKECSFELHQAKRELHDAKKSVNVNEEKTKLGTPPKLIAQGRRKTSENIRKYDGDDGDHHQYNYDFTSSKYPDFDDFHVDSKMLKLKQKLYYEANKFLKNQYLFLKLNEKQQ